MRARIYYVTPPSGGCYMYAWVGREHDQNHQVEISPALRRSNRLAFYARLLQKYRPPGVKAASTGTSVRLSCCRARERCGRTALISSGTLEDPMQVQGGRQRLSVWCRHPAARRVLSPQRHQYRHQPLSERTSKLPSSSAVVDQLWANRARHNARRRRFAGGPLVVHMEKPRVCQRVQPDAIRNGFVSLLNKRRSGFRPAGPRHLPINQFRDIFRRRGITGAIEGGDPAPISVKDATAEFEPVRKSEQA